MDRFNSAEDVSFNENIMSEGRLARMDGHAITENPYRDKDNSTHESWAFKSWNAGWADADMDKDAPKKAIY